MGNISEIDAMKKIDIIFLQVQDPQIKNRILQWAWDKFSTKSLPQGIEEENQSEKLKKKKTQKKVKKKERKRKTGLSIVKDLNLRPSGKKNLQLICAGKKPSSNQEKCLIAAYYLKNTLQKKVDVNSIYTCFKFANWRIPADLENTLCVIAVQKGWLDTTDLNDIKITTHGENHIEHDLPRKTKSKK